MSDSARDLLVRGIAAAKAGDNGEARRYLERVLNFNPTQQQALEAIYWLSEATQDVKEKRDLLESILLIAPNDARARRKFAVLNGTLKADEVIDPDRIQQPSAGTRQADDPRRFICPQCGGRMVFTPDGQSLTCEFCESSKSVRPVDSAADGYKERDFVLALATARGHLQPVNARVFHCQGCGVEFQLPANQMTLTCPYCLSAYVVASEEKVEVFLPDLIIPFAIDFRQARKQTESWFEQNLAGLPDKVDDPVGFYLPVWKFEVGGQLEWRGEQYINKQWSEYSKKAPLMERDVLVPAVKNLPWEFTRELAEYDLSGVKLFDEMYLADWPTEVYQVPLADASLQARGMIYDRLRVQDGETASMTLRNLGIYTAGMLVEAFNLVMFPVWSSGYCLDGKRYEMMVNGQTGHVRGDKPAPSVRSMFQRLFR